MLSAPPICVPVTLTRKNIPPSSSALFIPRIGTPTAFPDSTFFVDTETLDMLQYGVGPLRPVELSNRNKLPQSLPLEFPPATRPRPSESDLPSDASFGQCGLSPKAPKHSVTPYTTKAFLPSSANKWIWQALPRFNLSSTVDLLSEIPLSIVDRPKYMYDHVNLIGDDCHDPRILTAEEGIAMEAVAVHDRAWRERSKKPRPSSLGSVSSTQ